MSQKHLFIVASTREPGHLGNTELCGQFLSMSWGGVLCGEGGQPKAVEVDNAAMESVKSFLAG